MVKMNWGGMLVVSLPSETLDSDTKPPRVPEASTGSSQPWYDHLMKLTVEIPDSLLRKARARALQEGRSLDDFVAGVLRQKLDATRGASVVKPNWMEGFGKLRHLHLETERIQARIESAREVVESEEQE
jgi:hypothetical protein